MVSLARGSDPQFPGSTPAMRRSSGRAERKKAQRDLDHEDDLHGGGEGAEEAPVALP